VSFLELQRYDDLGIYKTAVLDLLHEDEVRNNLPIGILSGSDMSSINDRFLATVVDNGKIVLISICTKPFNIVLYEPKNSRRAGAVEYLANELQRIGYSIPGVTADRKTAVRFAAAYSGSGSFTTYMSLVLMRLDGLSSYRKAPGFCRTLEEKDISFVPSWENAFCEDCRIPMPATPDNVERLKSRLGTDKHFIWVDGEPVS